MTITETGVASPAQLAAELEQTLNERTKEVPERRRRGGHGRGWLMRSALTTAGVLGLAVAFVLAESRFGGGSSLSVGAVGRTVASLGRDVVATPLAHLIAHCHGLVGGKIRRPALGFSDHD